MVRCSSRVTGPPRIAASSMSFTPGRCASDDMLLITLVRYLCKIISIFQWKSSFIRSNSTFRLHFHTNSEEKMAFISHVAVLREPHILPATDSGLLQSNGPTIITAERFAPHWSHSKSAVSDIPGNQVVMEIAGVLTEHASEWQHAGTRRAGSRSAASAVELPPQS